MTFLISIVLFAFTFLVRWGSARNAVTAFDSYFYLYSIREVQRQKIGCAGVLSTRMLPAKSIRQPYFWQWCMSLLNQKWVKKNHRYINIILDSAYVVFIYLVLKRIHVEAEGIIFILLLYIFLPTFYSALSIGPRVNSITPRLWSEIFTNVLFINILLIPWQHPWLQIVTSAILITSVLLSSKFGIQAILFLIPICAIIGMEFVGLFALLLSLFVCTLLTRGEFINTLRAQLEHLSEYFLRNLRGGMAVSNRNSFSNILAILKSSDTFKFNSAKFVSEVLINNSFTATLLKFPVILSIFSLILVPSLSKELGLTLLAPLIASAILFLLINNKKLLFLGEAERYIMHVSFFWLLFSWQVAEYLSIEWVLPILIVYGVIYWIFESFLLPYFEPFKKMQAVDRDNRKLVDYLNSFSQKVRIAQYPYHVGGGPWRIMYETPHTVYYGLAFNKEETKEVRMFEANYPYFDIAKVDSLFQFYDLSLLIVDVKETEVISELEHRSTWHKGDVDFKAVVVFHYIPSKAHIDTLQN